MMNSKIIHDGLHLHCIGWTCVVLDKHGKQMFTSSLLCSLLEPSNPPLAQPSEALSMMPVKILLLRGHPSLGASRKLKKSLD